MRGRYFRFFFDSTAKTLVIYREFWYFSRIFPTLFSQLISIFMRLLHTFSKGVKIDARLPRSERFASVMRSGVLLRPPVSAGVLEPLKKMGGTPGLKKVNELVCSKRDHSHVCNGSNTPGCAAGGGKNATTHNGGEPFVPGKSRIDFDSLRECMEETHEYANELGKQGRKNPRKIPKFSINNERFSHTIEKNI